MSAQLDNQALPVAAESVSLLDDIVDRSKVAKTGVEHARAKDIIGELVREVLDGTVVVSDNLSASIDARMGEVYSQAFVHDADGLRADLVERYDEIVRSVQERPEFMVSMLKIEGASPEVDAAIRTMMPVKLPASSFQIDLEAMHDLITRLDAVAEARLVIRDGGTLDVNVTERVPAILWRHQTGIEMLDAEGHRVATLLDRGARPDLPLIAGRGAEKFVPEALDILAAATPILPRARGVVRVGERRWDIVLDRGQRIMLPQDNPVLAVERLLAIDAAEDLMDRDFTHLDLRNQDRPTIRLSEAALEAFQTIKGAETRVKK